MNLSRRELDANIVNIELTLASIIQGVALYFLTDNARTSLSLSNWPSLLYLSAGLCVICIFWSRSIIHTLTLIKWPLEFGHNFLYIACALGEALLFTRLEHPLAWFRFEHGLRCVRLAAFCLRLATDPRPIAGNDYRSRAVALSTNLGGPIAQYPIVNAVPFPLQSRLRSRH